MTLYAETTTSNSRRSRGFREGINRQRRALGLQPRDFEVEPLISYQVVRASNGTLLPFLEAHERPEIRRKWRSKYVRHIGAKQKARATR